MEVMLTEKSNQALEKGYKPKLQNALVKGNKKEIMFALKEFKHENGQVDFGLLFKIPSGNRLPQLAKADYQETFALVTGGLTLAFETMNLVRSINESQILELSDTILESASEDNLSLEDLMLFLQKLTRGEYGKLYESMDIPKFMEMFEIYREERFQALRNIRYEQSVNHKPDYSEPRLSEQSKREEQQKNLAAILNYQLNQKK